MFLHVHIACVSLNIMYVTLNKTNQTTIHCAQKLPFVISTSSHHIQPYSVVWELPYSKSFRVQPYSTIIECDNRCNSAYYCSIQCKTEAWEKYHKYLCPSIHPEILKLYKEWRSVEKYFQEPLTNCFWFDWNEWLKIDIDSFLTKLLLPLNWL
jgi:hypothetical protein